MTADKYIIVEDVADVTPEILAHAESIYDGWFADAERIVWNDFFDRLDGRTLDDGSVIDLGGSMRSPAIQEIKRHVRTLRREQG